MQEGPQTCPGSFLAAKEMLPPGAHCPDSQADQLQVTTCTLGGWRASPSSKASFLWASRLTETPGGVEKRVHFDLCSTMWILHELLGAGKDHHMVTSRGWEGMRRLPNIPEPAHGPGGRSPTAPCWKCGNCSLTPAADGGPRSDLTAGDLGLSPPCDTDLGRSS